MKTIIPLAVLFAACHSLSAKAADRDWDNTTAFMLAAASDCSYKVMGKKDEDNVEVLNCLIAATNRNPDTLKAFSGLKVEAVETFTDCDTANSKGKGINAAILVETQDGAIIAFRGTLPPSIFDFSKPNDFLYSYKSARDWVNDAKLTDVQNLLNLNLYPNGRHTGFNDSLQAMRTRITHDTNIWQRFAKQSGKTLYITGHSKGGALAQGAAVDFSKDFKGNIVSYTFEAPRFFTAKGRADSQDLTAHIWRFEYQYDAVPHVPLGQVTYDALLSIVDKLKLPEWMSKRVVNNNINFVPVGKLMFVGDDGELVRQPDQENGFYAERLKAIFQKINNTDVTKRVNFLAEQHGNYLSFLETQATGRTSLPTAGQSVTEAKKWADSCR